MTARFDDIRWGRVAPFVVLVLLVSAGVASAAVTSSFSSSYDGYNDGSDTAAPGHEIQVSGSLDFSGDSAVNPRIVIRDTDNTVLDESSVTLLQPGDTSIDFEKQYVENGVAYTADEIPAGTTLNLEFLVYPVAGLDRSELDSAEVVVTYAPAGGDRTRERFAVTTQMSNTPPQVISSIEQGDKLGLVVKGLAVVGALAVALVVLMALYSAVSGGSDDDSPLS
ncbi:MAG: hypothetical protein ABEJ82_04100 [Haloplanus sp.]